MNKLKKIILSVFTILAVSTVVFTTTLAQFSDEETSTANTYTSGNLNLQVNGADAILPFSVSDLTPGHTKGSPTYTLTNTGSLPGVVTLKVKNVKSLENNLIEPEESANDAYGTRLDPDNFTIAQGDGELLDQLYFRFWVDDTPGLRPAAFDWQDTKWEGYPDESSHYSMPVNADLFNGKNVILNPGATLYFGSTAKFIDDLDASYAWILDGIANNAAMDDSVEFDIFIGLKQVTP